MFGSQSTQVRLSSKRLHTPTSRGEMRVVRRSLLRCLRVVVLVFCVVVFAGCWGLGDRIEALVGKPAPDAPLLLIDGPETSIAAERGRYIGIIFWATWCNYSKGAMDQVEQLAVKYRDREDIRFFAVSIDRYQDIELLKNRIVSQQLHTVRHVFSGSDVDDDAYQRFNGEAIPYVVLIDPRGVVRYVGSNVGGAEDILDARFAR